MSFNFTIKSINDLEDFSNRLFQIKLLDYNQDSESILKLVAYNFDLHYRLYLKNNQIDLDKFTLSYGLFCNFYENEIVIKDSCLYLPIISKNKYNWFHDCFSIPNNIELKLELEINISETKNKVDNYKYSYSINK